MRPLALAIAALISSSAVAQIATDRPGLGFSPSLVARGTAQVEAGLPQASHLNLRPDVSLTRYSVPVLVRYGLADAVELRLSTSVYDAATASAGGGSGSDGDVGFDVLEVGAKVRLGGSSAVVTSLSVPTTEAGDVGLAGRWVSGFGLTDQLSLTAVLGARVTDTDPDRTLSAEVVGVVARALTGPLSGYVEAGAFPESGAVPAYAGGGLLLAVSPDVQLDASLYLGLTDDADDVLFGAGASVRF